MERDICVCECIYECVFIYIYIYIYISGYPVTVSRSCGFAVLNELV